MVISMKGYSLSESNDNKIKRTYNNEYGLNYYEKDNFKEDYDRFFSTKNNLCLHDKLKR